MHCNKDELGTKQCLRSATPHPPLLLGYVRREVIPSLVLAQRLGLEGGGLVRDLMMLDDEQPRCSTGFEHIGYSTTD
jgi:hypothetical protein